jgi:LysR family transcriptional regulator, hydrogen peroxide-inducible genes activator
MRFTHHSFTLRQLQYAVAVGEARSFGRAAARCHVSQPALSAQVAQLEEALGARLFERGTKLVITAAGEELLARARGLLAQADELADSAARGADPFDKTLRLGVIPTIAPYLLPEIAPALRAKYPKLRIVWVEEKTPALRTRLENGELDALIAARESALGDVVHAMIGSDAFVLAVPRDHALARAKKPARMEALADESVMLLDDGHCFRDQVLALCTRSGIPESDLRATSLATLVQMVAGGAGVTLLPSLALEAENRGGGLALRELAAPAPARTLVLSWRKAAPLAATLVPLARDLAALHAGLAKRALAAIARSTRPDTSR